MAAIKWWARKPTGDRSLGGLERLLLMATPKRHWRSQFALSLVTLSERIRHLFGGSLIISNCLPLRCLNAHSDNTTQSQRTSGATLFAFFDSATAVYSSHGNFQNSDIQFSYKTGACLVSAPSRRSHFDNCLKRDECSVLGAKWQQRDRQIILMNRHEVVG